MSNISKLSVTLWWSAVNAQELRPVCVSQPTWRSSKWSHISLESFSVFFAVFPLCATLWETVTEARKVELRGPPTEEEPLYKQFITLLRPVSPLPSYVSLPLSPLLCLFLLKKKKYAPSLPLSFPPPLPTPHLSPRHAVLSGSLV